MDDDYENDYEDELPEELKGKGKKVGMIKSTPRIGKAFFGFLKDFEGMSNKLDSLGDGPGKENVENMLVAAIDNAKVGLNRDFYALPFAMMHRLQKFPEEYDDHARTLCAVISADLATLKVLTDTVGENLKELNNHMEPILKRKQREARRKEGPSATPIFEEVSDESGPRSNVLDFAERRGRVKDKPRSTTYH